MQNSNKIIHRFHFHTTSSPPNTLTKSPRIVLEM